MSRICAGLQETFENRLRMFRNNPRIATIKPTMFIAVSLAAAFEDGLADAKDYVYSFLENDG